MEVVAKGPLPILNQKLSFPTSRGAWCRTRSGRSTGCPGLQVGQRWDSAGGQPVHRPGRARSGSRSQRRTLIHWNSEPVSTLEVVQHAGPLTARTWVRPDGLVLRQEVPFPFVELVLERQPEASPRRARRRGAAADDRAAGRDQDVRQRSGPSTGST